MKSRKTSTMYVCSQCGGRFPKWLGRCSECGAWNSLSEEEVSPRGETAPTPSGRAALVVPLDAVHGEREDRIPVDIAEVDRVLGGGLVAGSLVLLSGDPGIGKSTLLLQILNRLARQGRKVLYASGEESQQQIRLRAVRLDAVSPNIMLTSETDLDVILEAVRKVKPDVFVLDSIQTVFSQRFASSPGSVTQIRECTGMLLEPAKGLGIATFVVGHVTKDGAVAGPRVLEHLVDAVMYLEGDPSSGLRVLRAVKNRFGSTGEIGIFAMHEDGLAEVPDPSAVFLGGHRPDVPGSVVGVTMEGSRPVLVEVQALAGKSYFGMPRRLATGIDGNRLNILLAVLERHAGISLGDKDIFASVAGGLRIQEPALDLALAVAVASSVRGVKVSRSVACFGEVGLGGEIRAASHVIPRVQEVKKMGLGCLCIPLTCYRNEKARIDALVKGEDLQILPVETLGQAIERIL